VVESVHADTSVLVKYAENLALVFHVECFQRFSSQEGSIHVPAAPVDMLVNCLYVRVAWMLESTFFGNRVVKIWNSLPATVEDFANIRKFRSFIERVNLSQYVNFYFFFFLLCFVH